MSGDSFVFTRALGHEAYYWSLPAADDAIIVVLLQSSGLEADATLRDYDDLAALIAGTSNEATFTNYARKVLTTVGAGNLLATYDDTLHKVILDAPDQTWTSAGGAANNTIAKLLWCYRPASGSADSAIIPIVASSYDETTTGTSITAQVNSGGVMDMAA